jgi:hypothetical protein
VSLLIGGLTEMIVGARGSSRLHRFRMSGTCAHGFLHESARSLHAKRFGG